MPSAAPSAARATAVVVLNWNGRSDTMRCLRSLRAQEPAVHLILVDNGSTDGSVADVEAAALADEVIRAGKNLGYAGGNNLGLQHALADGYQVIAVLNNDTYLEAPVFSQLAAAVLIDPRLVLSPRIRYAEGDGVWFEGGVIDAGYPRHVHADELAKWPVVAGRRHAEVLSGCCIVAAATTWREVGVFDERLFLLFEDSDWSIRARAAGRRLAVVTDLEIRHAVSGSVRSRRTARLFAFYFGRNMIRFSGRHFPRSTARLARQWLGRPAVRATLGREARDDVFFRWLGAFSAVVGQSGIAPGWVQRLASIGSERTNGGPGVTRT